jgi:hypothetical protein
MSRGVQENKNIEESSLIDRLEARRGLRAWWRAAWLLLLLLASVEFIARGPWRAISESGDFVGSYLSARAWLRGDNPYDHKLLDQLWIEADDAPESRLNKFNKPSVYPPTALILIAPLALPDWRTAASFLMAINCLLAFLSLAALISVAGLDWRKPRGALFLVLGVSFAPLHTGIALGNFFFHG